MSLAVWPVSETQVFSLIGCNQSFDPVKFVSSNPSHPPPKSLLTINLGHLGTWKGIQVQTSSLLTMRRDCTDAWCIAIYFALCKFWIKLVHVYECLEKLRLNSFYCYAGQVPEIQNWLYCLRHQITSDTMPVWDRAWGGGDSRTRGEEPDLAQSLPALYHVLLYKCQIPTSQVSSYTPVQ